MDQSNAGQRILNSKRTLMGAQDALENYIGHGLKDGCQCFVLEQEANYRYLAQSKLKPDGTYVVAPHTGPGRWVRESGLVGFALLEGGKINGDQDLSGFFGAYTYQKLVQFEVTPEALVYVGSLPRLAQLSGACQPIAVGIVLLQGNTRLLAKGLGSTSTTALLHPGERILLRAEDGAVTDAPGSLQVILT